MKIGDPGVGGLDEDFLAFLIASPRLFVANVDAPLGLEIDFLAFFNAGPNSFDGISLGTAAPR